MKIALVSSSYLPNHGALERHVDRLAHGLARRGAAMEILTQGPVRGEQSLIAPDGVIIRRYPTVVGPLRFAVAPRLRERLRLAADEFDLVDMHVTNPALALAVAHIGFRRRVFTPRAPIQRIIGWPYARATLAVIDGSVQIVCNSTVERDLLCGRFPAAAGRTWVVPIGVDAAAIQAANPFPDAGEVVLTVGHLERSRRVERAIAAMASLDSAFRLIVVGDGPARHRLRARAADLRVAPRVQFVGSVPDTVLYRWLRTARVVVALSEQDSSGLQVTEALTAGAPVVASDIPVHREAAARFDRGFVIFVSPTGSPLEVADAIAEAGRLSVPSAASALATPCSWDSVVDCMWGLYGRLLGRAQPHSGSGDGTVRVPAQIGVEARPTQRMNVRD